MATPTLTRAASARARERAAGRTRRVTEGAGTGLEWLDVLRIGAIVAVVVNHAVGTATRKSGTGWHTAGWWSADLLNAACLWSVPVFVMVSGALLLDPSRAVVGGEFLRRRALRIGVPLAFWVAAYLIFERQFFGADLSAAETWHAVASGDPFLQLYFLFIVAGLTLMTPVLRRLIAHSSRREIYAFTAAALGFGLIEHAFRSLGGGGGFNAVTRFLPYIGYYLAGYALRTADLGAGAQRVSRRLFVAGWLATALGSGALAGRYGWTADGYFLYDYLSPTVMVMSLAAFVMARGWRPKRISSERLRGVGGATFGVFLIHPLLLFPLMRVLALPDPANLGRTVGWAVPLAGFVCLAATGICLVLARVPGVRRLIS